MRHDFLSSALSFSHLSSSSSLYPLYSNIQTHLRQAPSLNKIMSPFFFLDCGKIPALPWTYQNLLVARDDKNFASPQDTLPSSKEDPPFPGVRVPPKTRLFEAWTEKRRFCPMIPPAKNSLSFPLYRKESFPPLVTTARDKIGPLPLWPSRTLPRLPSPFLFKRRPFPPLPLRIRNTPPPFSGKSLSFPSNTDQTRDFHNS